MTEVIMDASRARALSRNSRPLNKITLNSINDFDNLGQFIELCASNSNYSLHVIYDFKNKMESERYDTLVSGLTINGFKVRKMYQGIGSEDFDLLISW